MVEPPVNARRRRVLEVDNGVLTITGKPVLVEQRARAVHQAAIVKRRCSADALLMKLCEERSRAGPIEAVVVIKDAAIQIDRSLRTTRHAAFSIAEQPRWGYHSRSPAYSGATRKHGNSQTISTLPPRLSHLIPSQAFARRGSFSADLACGLGGACSLMRLSGWSRQRLARSSRLGVTGQMSRIMNAQMQAKAHPGTPHHAVLLFTSLFVIVSDGLPLLAMLAAAWLFARGERRPLGAYGVGRKRWTDFLSWCHVGPCCSCRV